jgi:hypothetical protein
MRDRCFSRFALGFMSMTILCLWSPSLLRAGKQDSTAHPFFALANNAAPGSEILFAGETMDAIVTPLTETTENGILIQKGYGNAQTIAVSKWMVNGVQNGNSTYGTLVQQSTGYALYTAPSNGSYYGPITISAMVNEADGSQETALAPTIYIVPKNLTYTCCVATGCKCPGMVSYLNSQGFGFSFHLERSAQDQCNAVFDDGPTPIEGSPIKNYSPCNPIFEISNFDYGSDMEMSNPQCEYHGSDNLLHFTFTGRNPAFAGYTIKQVGSDKVVGVIPVNNDVDQTWTPQANISNLPFTSPDTQAPPSGNVLKTKYIVRVAQ